MALRQYHKQQHLPLTRVSITGNKNLKCKREERCILDLKPSDFLFLNNSEKFLKNLLLNELS